MSSIGAKLITCRQAAKLTQKEVAERLGIKTNTYGSWEADKTHPSGHYFPQLAEIFGVTLDKLFPNTKVNCNQWVKINKNIAKFTTVYK